MAQTILIENNNDLRQLFSLNLQTYAGTDVIIRKDGMDAIELLAILPTINLIVTRNKIDEEDTAANIVEYLQGNDLQIPVIVLGETPGLEGNVVILKEPFNWEVLIKEAGKLLGVTIEQLSKKVRPDFIPISLDFFYNIDSTPCDIYIRIRKSPTEFQFVKRLHANDKFVSAEMDKYAESGLKDFYVQKDYEQYFVTFLTNKIIEKLERNDLGMEERILTTASSFDLVKNQIEIIGLDERTVELADAGINSMVQSVQESPVLSNLLKFLFSSKISYAYQHSHLISVIGYYILSKLNAFKPVHLELLSSAAFFSDITLKSQEQIQINTQADLDKATISAEEKEEVKEHAKRAALLLKEYPHYPDELQTIILQHHGNKDGVGFNESPDEDLHPLAKIFMVTDAFVKATLRPDAPVDKKQIIDALDKQFQTPGLQRIVKVLAQKID